MDRNEIFSLINDERDYQDLMYDFIVSEGEVYDYEKTISEWLNFIEYHLMIAKNQVNEGNNLNALHELRKIGALTIRAMEIHGCPKRKKDDID